MFQTTNQHCVCWSKYFWLDSESEPFSLILTEHFFFLSCPWWFQISKSYKHLHVFKEPTWVAAQPRRRHLGRLDPSGAYFQSHWWKNLPIFLFSYICFLRGHILKSLVSNLTKRKQESNQRKWLTGFPLPTTCTQIKTGFEKEKAIFTIR